MIHYNNISVLGCGWLGLPLSEYLLAKGFIVKGSVRHEAGLQILQEKGIKPYQVSITDKEIQANDLNEFLSSDILIINFPPERRPDIEEYHPAQMTLLIDVVKNSPVKNVLFVSSTSVYPDLDREVFEDESAEPSKGSGKALKIVEEMLMNEKKFATTILRFAGLIGYDRLPGRFLAGKKDVENGDSPVNLIHQDDCIGLIHEIIRQNVWGEIFNACCDKHPTRKEYYIKAAKAIGLEPPSFADSGKKSFKIINSDKIKSRLGYKFKYPDPLALIDSGREESND